MDMQAVISEAQRVFTNVKITFMDGINHAPFHENPEGVMKHVGGFVYAVWDKVCAKNN